MRQQNQQQRAEKGIPSNKRAGSLKSPTDREKWNQFVAVNKWRRIVKEIEFHLRAHHQRGENCGQQIAEDAANISAEAAATT